MQGPEGVLHIEFPASPKPREDCARALLTNLLVQLRVGFTLRRPPRAPGIGLYQEQLTGLTIKMEMAHGHWSRPDQGVRGQ